MSHRDTVAALIFLGCGFHFKAIEGAALPADADLRQLQPEVAIEAVLVHAEEARRVAEANEARHDVCRRIGAGATDVHRRPFRSLRFRPFRDELSLNAIVSELGKNVCPSFRAKPGKTWQ